MISRHSFRRARYTIAIFLNSGIQSRPKYLSLHDSKDDPFPSFYPKFWFLATTDQEQQAKRLSMADVSKVGPPLNQASGYGIILGLGFAFALGMIGTTWALKRYHNEVQTSEAFSTAGRSVKSGLVASAVVSSWTWAATLLQSSSVAYNYGVSGPFWYASGATVQVILFATLAIELKRRAPNAHTFLETVRARYGKATHIVFLVFALMTNILVTAMLLTGGSAVVQSLTGVPTAAACFLLPIGVVLYTMFGGIKVSFPSLNSMTLDSEARHLGGKFTNIYR